MEDGAGVAAWEVGEGLDVRGVGFGVAGCVGCVGLGEGGLEVLGGGHSALFGYIIGYVCLFYEVA